MIVSDSQGWRLNKFFIYIFFNFQKVCGRNLAIIVSPLPDCYGGLVLREFAPQSGGLGFLTSMALTCCGRVSGMYFVISKMF